MYEHDTNDVSEPWGFQVRGKLCTISKHAFEGMAAERPPISADTVARVLEDPDHDDGTQARKRLGGRTILVRYEALEDRIRVRGVSATRRRLPP